MPVPGQIRRRTDRRPCGDRRVRSWWWAVPRPGTRLCSPRWPGREACRCWRWTGRRRRRDAAVLGRSARSVVVLAGEPEDGPAAEVAFLAGHRGAGLVVRAAKGRTGRRCRRRGRDQPGDRRVRTARRRRPDGPAAASVGVGRPGAPDRLRRRRRGARRRPAPRIAPQSVLRQSATAGLVSVSGRTAGECLGVERRGDAVEVDRQTSGRPTPTLAAAGPSGPRRRAVRTRRCRRRGRDEPGDRRVRTARRRGPDGPAAASVGAAGLMPPIHFDGVAAALDAEALACGPAAETFTDPAVALAQRLWGQCRCWSAPIRWGWPWPGPVRRAWRSCWVGRRRRSCPATRSCAPRSWWPGRAPLPTRSPTRSWTPTTGRPRRRSPCSSPPHRRRAIGPQGFNAPWKERSRGRSLSSPTTFPRSSGATTTVQPRPSDLPPSAPRPEAVLVPTNRIPVLTRRVAGALRLALRLDYAAAYLGIAAGQLTPVDAPAGLGPTGSAAPSARPATVEDSARGRQAGGAGSVGRGHVELMRNGIRPYAWEMGANNLLPLAVPLSPRLLAGFEDPPHDRGWAEWHPPID